MLGSSQDSVIWATYALLQSNMFLGTMNHRFFGPKEHGQAKKSLHLEHFSQANQISTASNPSACLSDSK
jgi:hypothetical protein